MIEAERISIQNLLVIAGKCTPKTVPRMRARMAKKLEFGEDSCIAQSKKKP